MTAATQDDHSDRQPASPISKSDAMRLELEITKLVVNIVCFRVFCLFLYKNRPSAENNPSGIHNSI